MTIGPMACAAWWLSLPLPCWASRLQSCPWNSHAFMAKENAEASSANGRKTVKATMTSVYPLFRTVVKVKTAHADHHPCIREDAHNLIVLARAVGFGERVRSAVMSQSSVIVLNTSRNSSWKNDSANRSACERFL